MHYLPLSLALLETLIKANGNFKVTGSLDSDYKDGDSVVLVDGETYFSHTESCLGFYAYIVDTEVSEDGEITLTLKTDCTKLDTGWVK